MPDELELQSINERKENLEQQLKELNALRDKILEWKKDSDKKEELNKLNQEIASVEKELFKIKLQELRALREQIVIPENQEWKEKKQLDKKLSNVENLFEKLESKIEQLDWENERRFEKQKREIEKVIEDLNKEMTEFNKKSRENLDSLEAEVYMQKVQKILPDHDINANRKRVEYAIQFPKEIKQVPWWSKIANAAARAFHRIMGDEEKMA